MAYIKIQKAYATATYECSVVTNVLSAWISNDKKVVLLGYGCKPTEDGFVKATAEGLLLLSKDLDNIRVLVENLTINDKFESCFSQKQTVLSSTFPADHSTVASSPSSEETDSPA